jgi:zinc protease
VHSEDQPALDLLSDILGNTRAARINKTLIYDKQLAAAVSVFQSPAEGAGQFEVIVTPRAGHSLTEMETQVDSMIAQMKRDGPTEEELKRVKAGQQRSLLGGLETNLGKALQLGQNQTFFDNPSHSFTAEYEKTQAVTAADVKRVANKYLGKSRVVLSNVPTGKRDVAAHAAKSTVVTDPFTEKSAEVRP